MNRVTLSFVALVHIATAGLVGRDAEERGQNHGAASDINRPDFETLGADLDQIGWSSDSRWSKNNRTSRFARA
jgi:hypothetical protein